MIASLPPKLTGQKKHGKAGIWNYDYYGVKRERFCAYDIGVGIISVALHLVVVGEHQPCLSGRAGLGHIGFIELEYNIMTVDLFSLLGHPYRIS